MSHWITCNLSSSLPPQIALIMEKRFFLQRLKMNVFLFSDKHFFYLLYFWDEVHPASTLLQEYHRINCSACSFSPILLRAINSSAFETNCTTTSSFSGYSLTSSACMLLRSLPEGIYSYFLNDNSILKEKKKTKSSELV